jgi:hypothetical protein
VAGCNIKFRKEGNKMRKKKYYIIAVAILLMLAIFVYTSKINSNNVLKVNENKVGTNDNQEPTNADEAENITTNSNSEVLAKVDLNETETSLKVSDKMEDVYVEIDKLVNQYYENSKEIDKEILASEKQSDEEAQTKETIAKIREVIEAYKHIKTYVKPGLEENTYVVFATYDIKLYNIDTLVPGMSSLLIVQDDAGVLRVKNTTNEDNVTEYINQLSKEEDMKEVIENVNAKLEDLVKKDSTVKEFVTFLNEIM